MTVPSFAPLRRTCARFATAVAVSSTLLAAPLVAQASSEVLSNASVVQMVTGKLSRDLIIAKVNSSQPGFDLSSSGIIALANSKVDEKIVKAMFDAGQAARQRNAAPASLSGLDEVLNNDAVIRLVAAKIPKQIIMTKMQLSNSAYDVSAGGLVKLSEAKVPQDLIKVMMSPPVPPTAAAAAPPAAPAAVAVPEAKKATPPAPEKKAGPETKKATPPPASTTKKPPVVTPPAKKPPV